MTRKMQAALVVALLLLNLVAFNVLLKGASARLDLTEQREYTISDATGELLAGLPDQVSVYGYFSEQTHKWLAPLVPKLRDLLEELRVRAGGKLRVRFLDPTGDEEVEKEANQRFGVKPAALPVQSKYEAGVRATYFHVVVAFGDQHETLELRQLIDVTLPGDDPTEEPVISLKNPEYQLARAIQKVVRAFGSLESRVAQLAEPIEVTAFLTQAVELASEQAELVKEVIDEKQELLESVRDRIAERFEEGLRFELLDPAADEEALAKARQYRVQPMRASVDDPTPIFIGLVVQHEDRYERIPLRGKPAVADVVDALEGSIRRFVPGALPRVGLVTAKPDIPPEQLMQMRMQGMEPPSDDFETLRWALRESYAVREVKLSGGRPPLEVDVLVVLKPKDLDEKARFALDQYLMLGGRAIVFVDGTEIDEQGSRFGDLQLRPIQSGLDDLLAHYGVTVEDLLVQDMSHMSLVLPRMVHGQRRYAKVGYPWFLDIRGDGIDSQSPVVGDIEQLGMMWASPLELDESKQPEARFQRLLRSSDEAWTSAELKRVSVPEQLLPPAEKERQLLAVAIDGTLGSFWKDREPPAGIDGEPEEAEPGDEAGEPASLEEAAGAAPKRPTLAPVASSPASTRLVVIGDADMVADSWRTVPQFAENLTFVANLIDWALLDEQLIGIRSRGVRQRPLEPLTRSEQMTIEVVNYGIPLLLVVGFGVIRLLMRGAAARRRGVSQGVSAQGR